MKKWATHIYPLSYFKGTSKVIFALSFGSKLDFVTCIGAVCRRSGKHDATPAGH